MPLLELHFFLGLQAVLAAQWLGDTLELKPRTRRNAYRRYRTLF
jgi:hypothetical protein